jgi:hypothetical protein
MKRGRSQPLDQKVDCVRCAVFPAPVPSKVPSGGPGPCFVASSAGVLMTTGSRGLPDCCCLLLEQGPVKPYLLTACPEQA